MKRPCMEACRTTYDSPYGSGGQIIARARIVDRRHDSVADTELAVALTVIDWDRTVLVNVRMANIARVHVNVMHCFPLGPDD